MAASDYINQVQSMYIAYYGRFADQAGLNYWTYMLDANGGNLDGIIQAFGTSAEATALYPATLSTAQKVTNLYNSLFGRDPDAAGLTYYTNLIGSGQATLVDIAKRVFDGATAEDANRLANKVNASNNLTSTVGASTNYSGDAAAATARALMSNITNDPASITPVQNVMGAAVTSAKTTGTAITTMTAATAAATGSNVQATSASAAQLDGYSSFGAQNLTITDAAGTNIAASVLSSIGGKTTGTVTVQNAINITGTVAQATAALVTPATLVTAATANVTFTSTATTTAADLKAIDAATTGAIDASNVDAITALAAADFAIVGGTNATGTGGVIKTKDAVAVTVADAISATNLNTLAGLTTGVVTATVTADTAANLVTNTANASATDALTFTLSAGAIAAADLNTLDGRTSVAIDVSPATSISGDFTAVNTILVTNAANFTNEESEAYTLTGTTAANNVNTIANATSGVVTATVTADIAANLVTNTANASATDALTFTLSAGAIAAADLNTLDGRTSVAIDVSPATLITGSLADVKTILIDNAANFTNEESEAYTLTGGINAGSYLDLGLVANATSGILSFTLTNTNGTIANLATGDNFATGITFASNTSAPLAADSALNWNLTGTTLTYEIADDGLSTTVVTLDLTGIAGLTETGGVFTIA